MKRWYHEGYVDPKTKKRITGRELMRGFIRSGNYVKNFLQYTRSLDIEMFHAL